MRRKKDLNLIYFPAYCASKLHLERERECMEGYGQGEWGQCPSVPPPPPPTHVGTAKASRRRSSDGAEGDFFILIPSDRQTVTHISREGDAQTEHL